MKKSKYYSLLGIKLAFSAASFALLVASSIPIARPTAQPVLRVPQDYPTIQAAIDAAPEGAVILIGHQGPFGGVYYEESITITKSVTLRGDPPLFRPFIRGPETVFPVIYIASDAPIQVALENIGVLEGEAGGCIQVEGQAHVGLNKVEISYVDHAGLRVRGSAHVTLQDSIISGFAGFGLDLIYAADAVVEIINSQISGTNENIGLSIGGPSRISLQNSTISGHGGGILAYDSTQVTLRDSVVTGNGTGIEVLSLLLLPTAQPAVVTLENSQISSNRRVGLLIENSVVELRNSLVVGNGIDPKCQQLPLRSACSGSGILIEEGARLKLRSTEIRSNATWGVAAYLPQCGAPSYAPPFPFEVIFEDDKNVIENNNRSGVLNGMDNPGNHPLKDLPDGQVCLP